MDKVKLAIPLHLKITSPSNYKWFKELADYLKVQCPAFDYEWEDTGRWFPDYVHVDSETALILILRHGLTEITQCTK